MEKIDVIMLSNNIDDVHYNLSKKTIDTLKIAKGVDLNIFIIESNFNSQYTFDGCEVIKPNEKFNYAKFVNIGYSHCTNDWIMIINNDLEFTQDCFVEIFKVYNSNTTYESFSFYEPNYHDRYFKDWFNDDLNVYEGYEVGPRLSGWCILHKKRVMDVIKEWDTRFVFFYVDDDYGQTIKLNNIKNVMVKSAVVYHKLSQSHDTIPNMTTQQAMDDAKIIYEKKWIK